MLKITNPLTIIAVFSGIAEAFATIALIALPIEIQHIFIWFVMAFPVLIVIAFFIILIEKPMLLYGPSDYEDQKDFLLTVGIIDKEDSYHIAKEILGDLSEENKPEVKIENISRTIINQVYGKDEVIKILKEYPDKYFSINDISEILGISMASIKNHIYILHKNDLVESKLSLVEGEGFSRQISLWKIKKQETKN